MLSWLSKATVCNSVGASMIPHILLRHCTGSGRITDYVDGEALRTRLIPPGLCSCWRRACVTRDTYARRQARITYRSQASVGYGGVVVVRTPKNELIGAFSCVHSGFRNHRAAGRPSSLFSAVQRRMKRVFTRGAPRTAAAAKSLTRASFVV